MTDVSKEDVSLTDVKSEPEKPRSTKLRSSTPALRQFGAVARKSLSFQRRQIKTNTCQIVLPLFLVLLMLLIQEIGRGAGALGSAGTTQAAIPHPAFKPANPLSFPSGLDMLARRDCISIAKGLTRVPWIPKPPTYFDNLKLFLSEAQPAGDENTAALIGNITDGSFIYFYRDPCRASFFASTLSFDKMYASKDNTDDLLYKAWYSPKLGGYLIQRLNLAPGASFRGLKYAIYVNASMSSMNSDLASPLYDILGHAVFKAITNQILKFSGIKAFPSPEILRQLDIVTFLAPFFLIIIFNLLLPLILGSLVYEKEMKLRQIMKMMGLRDLFYWSTAFIYNFIVFLTSSFLVLAISIALNFRFAVVNDFGVWAVIMISWGFNLVSFCAMISVFFNRTRTSHVIGYLYVFALSFVSSIAIGPLFAPDATTSPIGLFALQLVPQFSFYRALAALTQNVQNAGDGVRFADLSNAEFRIVEVMLFHIIEGIVFLLLAWYLEQVWPNAGTAGVRRSPLFCFTREYWRNKEADEIFELRHSVSHLGTDVSDVEAERHRVATGSDDFIVLDQLAKTYPGNPVIDAVKPTTFGVTERSCFGLLGPNGAGKSTIVNILCGLLRPTSGTARIGGRFDIMKDLNNVHANLGMVHTYLHTHLHTPISTPISTGVCPQDNILWGDLTGREHVLFYARLANLHGSQLKSAVDDLLTDVGLQDAAGKLAGSYSGGMQRRLSVACALIGDKPILLLDEPTTGLDPANKQQLWGIIRKRKQNGSMLLTTHSLEEADALVDRMCIIAEGIVQCIGTPAELKQRYGKGYRITIKNDESSKDKIDSFIMEHFPGSVLLNTLGGTSHYEVPRDAVDLGKTFRVMEGNKDELAISDWGITSTTLEEVFAAIVDQVEE